MDSKKISVRCRVMGIKNSKEKRIFTLQTYPAKGMEAVLIQTTNISGKLNEIEISDSLSISVNPKIPLDKQTIKILENHRKKNTSFSYDFSKYSFMKEKSDE